ncbi:hypothetical protein BH24ACT4_BH24ACT4_03950 [soil metagenome]
MRPYLRSANVTWAGIDTADVKEMNFDPGEAATFELAPGDLLLNEASGSPNEVGKPAIWREEIPGCCFQNTLLRVRSPHLSSGYLYWYCHASALHGDFGDAGRGVNIRHLGKRGLTSFPLPLPPRPEQERIVAAVDEHLSRLDAAETGLAAARLRIRAMEISIITRAALTLSPPSHWSQITVAEAGRVGLGLQRSPKRHQGPNMRPYLRVANVFEDRIDDGDVKTMDISDAEWERYQLHDGDVLLNEGQSPDLLGRPAIYRGDPPDVAFTNSLIRFQAGEGVDPEWALLVFRSHMHTRRFMRESNITTNIAHLAAGRFKTVEFPVPPMDEQRSRVAEARRGLEACTRLRADLTAAQKRAAAVRRSILAAAFSGQLVTQDPDDEPASMLLERIATVRAAATPPKPRRKSASA